MTKLTKIVVIIAALLMVVTSTLVFAQQDNLSADVSYRIEPLVNETTLVIAPGETVRLLPVEPDMSWGQVIVTDTK